MKERGDGAQCSLSRDYQVGGDGRQTKYEIGGMAIEQFLCCDRRKVGGGGRKKKKNVATTEDAKMNE